MKNEILINVFTPLKDEDWVLLETNKAIYSLRLSGYRKESIKVDFLNYKELPFPFKDYLITDVLSDGHWMFILLENDGVISCGEIDISFGGEIIRGVDFETRSGFEKGFFESGDLHIVITGNDGWSVAQ